MLQRVKNIFRFTTARAQGIAIGGTREAVELSALSRIISEDHILSEFTIWTIIFKSLNRRSIINSSKIIFFFQKSFLSFMCRTLFLSKKTLLQDNYLVCLDIICALINNMKKSPVLINNLKKRYVLHKSYLLWPANLNECYFCFSNVALI